MGGESVGGEDHPVAVARSRFAEVEESGDRAGQRRAVDARRPDLRELGAVRFSLAPEVRFRSVQVVLPSAAFGLIENPLGR